MSYIMLIMKHKRRQFLDSGLFAVWAFGFLFVIVSFYATQLLLDQRMDAYNATAICTLTIFTVPKPFHANVGAFQAQAIRSWLQLSPHIRIILLGVHPSLNTFAEKMGDRVTVDSAIDLTFSGVPLFSSVLARAYSATSDISVLIDPEFVLMEDFMDTIKHVHKLQYSWLLVATAKSLQLLPFKMHIRDGFWVDEHNQSVKSLEVQAYANQFGVWKGCNSRYLWAWSTEHVPLHVGVTPSFVYGHGFHDEWLLNEALSSGIRFVFDASDAISAFYLTRESNSYGEVGDAASLSARKNIWERDNNAHLAALYGSFYFCPVDFVNMPPKLISCVNHGLKVFQFIYPQSDMNPAIESREIPSIEGPHLSEMIKLSIKFQSTNKSFSTSFRRFSRQKRSTRYICPTEIEKSYMGFKSLKKKLISGNLKVQCDCNNVFQEAIDCKSSNMKWLPKIRLDRSSYESASFSLESLLALVSDENKIIVLSVVGYNYKDMLMSWVCRLRKLQISSYVIGAIDKQLYEFGILQGLPVFMVGKSMDVSFNDCHFGTECFKKVTKMKSRVVLQVLKLGYRVLFSDVDVYWFKNPIDYLMSFGPGTLVAQSDEWHIKGAPNKPRHLNSGFYFVWPDSSTIAAFEAIVMHASLSNMSEQPSFYDVLCGISGVHRVGATQCLDLVTNVTTHFLDRELFPNGAYKELWEKKNVSDACILQGCYVLHNNWVSGRQRKLNRQIATGLWDYDVKNRICMRS